MGKGIDEVAAVKEGVDVTRVVSGSCFAQRGRMYPKKMNWLSPAGFGRAPSCLNSGFGGAGVATVGREVIKPVVDDTVWSKRRPHGVCHPGSASFATLKARHPSELPLFGRQSDLFNLQAKTVDINADRLCERESGSQLTLPIRRRVDRGGGGRVPPPRVEMVEGTPSKSRRA